MKSIYSNVKELQKTSVKDKINERLNELVKNRKTEDKVFSELCFCLTTANFQAKKCWELQNKYEKFYLSGTEEELKNILKSQGHRFWEQRAQRIVLARKNKKELFKKINEDNIRDWIVEKFKGIGMKEASHFLRNIGNFDYAIIDFHIIDLLVNEKIIERPKSITKKKYLEIENKLKTIANKLNMSLGELDFYLWFLETGTILK